MNDYQDRLRGLEAEARRLRPPASAAAFHRSYLSAVRDYGAVIRDIHAAMATRDTSLAGRLNEWQGKADGSLRSADSELGALLARYGLERTFTVGDGSGSGLLNVSP